jgi:hypothetical protein
MLVIFPRMCTAPELYLNCACTRTRYWFVSFVQVRHHLYACHLSPYVYRARVVPQLRLYTYQVLVRFYLFFRATCRPVSFRYQRPRCSYCLCQHVSVCFQRLRCSYCLCQHVSVCFQRLRCSYCLCQHVSLRFQRPRCSYCLCQHVSLRFQRLRCSYCLSDPPFLLGLYPRISLGHGSPCSRLLVSHWVPVAVQWHVSLCFQHPYCDWHLRASYRGVLITVNSA